MSTMIEQHVAVVQDVLSDGSIAFGVLLQGQWGVVKFDCVDRAGAEELYDALKAHAHDFNVISNGHPLISTRVLRDPSIPAHVRARARYR